MQILWLLLRCLLRTPQGRGQSQNLARCFRTSEPRQPVAFDSFFQTFFQRFCFNHRCLYSRESWTDQLDSAQS